MKRLVAVLVSMVVMVGSIESSRAQGPAPRPSAEAALARAKQLDQQVEKLYSDGKFAEAMPLAEQSLAIKERVLGRVHPDVAESLNNLAMLHKKHEEYDKAEPLFLRTLAIVERTWSPSHPQTATILNNLAMLYYAQGAYDKAEPLFLRALAIQERTLDPLHPDLANSLHNIGILYYLQGSYAKAEPLLLRELAIREQTLNPLHPDLASAAHDLATLYYAQGDYAKAEPLLLRALDISKRALGPTHLHVTNTINNLAMLYQSQDEYAKAEPLYLHALDIRMKALGPLHPEVATVLNNLAMLYDVKGEYAKAEPLYRRALDIRVKAFGPLHPEVGKSHNNLATLYKQQGDYAKAEPLYARALEIQEKALGPQHPDVATIRNNLAMLFLAQGAYTKAEPLFLRALALREQILGPRHLDVAQSANNLAGLYQALGTYSKAEILYARALDIREKTLGTQHSDVASSLNNLAMLYIAQGAYSKAEPLLLRSLDIRQKMQGPQHRDTAQSLVNLTHVYARLGNYTKANALSRRALDIREQTLGLQHPDVAESLDNLALTYQALETHDKAHPLLLRALDIRKKTLGVRHPRVADSLNHLAALYQRQGSIVRAEEHLLRALAIREQTQGISHPDVARNLDDLAELYWAQGDYNKAEPLLVRAASIYEHQLRNELSSLTEPRKRALMQMLGGHMGGMVSFHAHDVPGRASALELALTSVLRNKGRVLDSLADNQIALRGSLTPALREQLDQLTEARAQLTAQLYGRKEPTDHTNRRSQLDALRTHIEKLETSLSAASAEFRSQAEPVTIAKVQAELPAGSALVELVHYRRFDARDTSTQWKEERYQAYVLRPTGPPTWVALGEAGPIDAEVEALRAGMDREPGMPQAEIERRQQQARAALQKLHGLLMAPLAGSLQGVSHLLIAPDGKLNLVPFEALVDGKGEYVLQRHLVSYLSSGRDLLRLATKRPAAATPTIVAAPDYGPGTPFAVLPGALAEGQELRRALPQGQLLTGRAASKEALAKLVGPSVLHVATHGFYARGANGTSATVAMALPRDPTRGMFIESFDSALPMPPPPEGDEFDALDRAGLALAGANSSADGIITAREIAGLNWSGTQLVVLSACETGIGAVATGEGVYGLRRALVLSGAQAQVVSLWNVADASTLALMKSFYAELARGTGRAEALRRAKLALLQEPRYAHPYYWAPFIPAGDWRPLESSVFARR